MPTRLTNVIAYLITPPARPRYQDRTMEAAFMAADADCAEVGRRRELQTIARLDQVASRFADGTSGAVRLMKVPLVAGAVLLIALGFSHIV